jgi:hypothetical protein
MTDSRTSTAGARAQSEPQGIFTAATNGADEEKNGDIDAGNQQDD